jgi:hypothetical protein
MPVKAKITKNGICLKKCIRTVKIYKFPSTGPPLTHRLLPLDNPLNMPLPLGNLFAPQAFLHFATRQIPGKFTKQRIAYERCITAGSKN